MRYKSGDLVETILYNDEGTSNLVKFDAPVKHLSNWKVVEIPERVPMSKSYTIESISHNTAIVPYKYEFSINYANKEGD